MPATYEPIQSVTLASAAASITFSSIPNTYTDLRIVFTGTSTSTATYVQMRMNNVSTGNLYSWTRLTGNGTAAASSRATNYNESYLNDAFPFGSTNSGMVTADILSYTASVFKTTLTTASVDQNGSGGVERHVHLFRSTNAISTIQLLAYLNNFAAGTTATLYGIKAA